MGMDMKKFHGEMIKRKISEKLKEEFRRAEIAFEMETVGSEYIEAVRLKLYGFREAEHAIASALLDRISEELMALGYNNLQFKYPKRTPLRLKVVK